MAAVLLRRPVAVDNAAMDAEPTKADPPKRKRRWFQFSLRTLLVFTLIVAIGCAWVAHRIQQKRKEREIVDTICKFGGRVMYDCDKCAPGTKTPIGPPGPDWLRKLLGDYFFSDVEIIALNQDPDADARMVNVKSLTQIQYLDLARTNVSDDGLSNLDGLTKIKTLYLHDTRITDAGLIHLHRLAALRMLYLTNTSVTDAGVESLKGLTQLKQLDLSGTRVTVAGMNALQKALPNCQILVGDRPSPMLW